MKQPKPFRDRRTGKVYEWENPDFTPGVHCVCCRFNTIPELKYEEPFQYVCENCIEKQREWKRASDRAMKAVATKRKKYSRWPANYKKQQYPG